MINTKNIDGDSPIRTKTFYGVVTGDLTTGDDKGAIPIVGLDTYGGEVTRVDLAVGTAPVGATLDVVIANGSTDISNPSIAVSGRTGSDTTIVSGNVDNGTVLDIDIDQVGSGTAGSNLLVAVTVKVHGSIEG